MIWSGRYAPFSNATANESSERDRSRFRRMPRSTFARRFEAVAIHSKSADSFKRFNSRVISLFRTSSGVFDCRNIMLTTSLLITNLPSK